ncbi:hypothetical protein HF086_002477 [Spodoptera exigua]|uniref:U1-type domain-containing protein n=1 Tax=Spodoptera exigua TaxID=7107 RepID=A0A922MH13_SPOEX|nr:hypothetical protein HF086_002477 [Spodoptera exigua]
MNILTENVSYIIPVEELDLLHLRKYMERPNDRPMKLWSNAQLKGESEYYEVKIISKEMIENPDISYSVLTQTYLCHICNKQVPIACHLAHKESSQQNTNKNILNTALRRISKHMNTEQITKTEKLDHTMYFCDICCKIIRLNDKLKHETSTEHLNSMDNYDILNKFNSLFSIDVKDNVNNDDRDSIKDNYCNDSDEDSNTVTETTESLSDNSDDTPNKSDKDYELTGVTNHQIYCRYHDNDKETMNKNHNDCDVEIVVNNNNQVNEDSKNNDDNFMYFCKYYERELTKCIEDNESKDSDNKIDIDRKNFDQGNETSSDYSDDGIDDYQSSNEDLNGIKKDKVKIDDQKFDKSSVTRRYVSLKQRFIEFKNNLENTSAVPSVSQNKENNFEKLASINNNSASHLDLNCLEKSKVVTPDQSLNQLIGLPKHITAAQNDATKNNVTAPQQIDLQNVSETKTINFDNYLKRIIDKFNVNTKINTEGDYVVLESTNGVKIKVLQQYFHSYKVICNKIYCQLCKFWIQDFTTSLSSHEISERHVKLVLLPINENFFRELTSNTTHEHQPGHCIVCNEAVLIDSKFHLTSENHRKAASSSVIPVETNLVPASVFCATCNEHIKLTEYFKHLDSKSHLKIIRAQNFISKRASGIYTCNLCEVVLNNIAVKHHLVEKGHLDNLKEMSPAKEFCKTCGFQVKKDDLAQTHKCKPFLVDSNSEKDGQEIPKDYRMDLKDIDENLNLCTVCNVELTKKESEINEHMTSAEHIELEKMQLYTLLLHYCERSEKFQCEICPLEFRNDNKIVIKHMEGDVHQTYEKTLFQFHRVEKKSKSYFCGFCKENIIDILGHIQNKEHVLMLQANKKINKTEMVKYLYETHGINPTALLYEKLYGNLLLHNSVSKIDANKYYCDICSVYFNRVNEIGHILGERHHNKLYRNRAETGKV